MIGSAVEGLFIMFCPSRVQAELSGSYNVEETLTRSLIEMCVLIERFSYIFDMIARQVEL